ncbi:hypothetical protein Tco_1065046 [Tanacetum coccineum]
MPGRPLKNRIKCVTENENEISRTVVKKRKPGRKRKNAPNQPYMPPDPAFQDPYFTKPHFADPHFADSYYADTTGSASVDPGFGSVDPGSTSADPRSTATNDPRSTASDVHTFTGLLQSVEQQKGFLDKQRKWECIEREVLMDGGDHLRGYTRILMITGNGYSRKGRKTKPKTTKPSTEWKRQSQIEAKVSQSQKVNPDKVKSQPSEENTT